jgi:hypothetical protein
LLGRAPFGVEGGFRLGGFLTFCFLCFIKLVTKKGVRGTGADNSHVDEGGFVHEDLYKVAIIPQLIERKACLTITTTPGESTSGLNILINARLKDGRPVFKTVVMSNICEECRKLPPEQAKLCTCNSHKVPTYLSQSKRQKYEDVYKTDPLRIMREMFGLDIESGNAMFPTQFVDNYLKRENRIDLVRSPQVIVLTCDPSGGGASLMTFTAVVGTATKRIVSCVCLLLSFLRSCPCASSDLSGTVCTSACMFCG